MKVLVALAAVVLVGCGGAEPEPTAASDTAAPDTAASDTAAPDTAAGSTAGIPGGPREDVPSALDEIDAAGLPEAAVDADSVTRGAARDAIPAIDDPVFEAAGDVDWLSEDEAVIALSVPGGERAYPVRILLWHEIVNDTVGELPLALTYCPLCNSALAFDRRLDERVLSFGVSGLLRNSDLVMYDRQTESLFQQIEGTAIAGVLTGAELTRVPVQTVTWSAWRDAHPDGSVLSRDTGHDRDYGRNPYVGYDEPGSAPFLFDGAADPRLPPKERVVGIDVGPGAVALPLGGLVEAGVTMVDEHVVFAEPGLRSALDADEVADGRVVGATGVFVPEADGQQLSFTREGTGFVDAETSSTWSILGTAVDGPLTGAQLEAVEHVDTFWFAWASFHPETRIERA